MLVQSFELYDGLEEVYKLGYAPFEKVESAKDSCD
jgi:hypothetical protein